jgi:hypothetical protein
MLILKSDDALSLGKEDGIENIVIAPACLRSGSGSSVYGGFDFYVSRSNLSPSDGNTNTKDLVIFNPPSSYFNTLSIIYYLNQSL